ncbi:MAG TPA: ABC transporter permease [Micromonosporaceae bacterium]|nr:ABC transporter permease [Micromonosporaceae bacterium]
MVVSALSPTVYVRIDAALHRSTAVTARNVTALRSAYWLLLVSGFFEPLLYLLSIGVGVGSLIHGIPVDGHLVRYAVYVAPAMLASSAMTGALTEATFNFFGKMKFQKTYDIVLATPVRPMEIAFGELWWAMFRGALYSGAFLVIMVIMHMTTALWALVAFPATLLVGFAFGGIGMALSTFMRSWQDFDVMATVQIALFLFSATFTPLSVYSQAWVRGLIELSPLYQSVALIRGITLGHPTVGLLVHVGYLAALTLVGLAVAARRMHRQLLK